MTRTLLIALLGLMTACSADSDIDIRNAHETLMTLHDESMARHSQLKKIKKQLKKLDQPDQHRELRTLVVKADKDMWDWMHNWKDPDADLSKEEKLAYYDQWQKKMEIVDKQIIDALDMAKKELQ